MVDLINGYEYVYDPNNKRSMSNGIVYKHIIEAEKKLGRELNHGEVVHHIDGNRSNNDASNLMVFASNRDHSAFHRGGDAYEIDGVFYTKQKKHTCEYCGKEFVKTHGGQRFCSVLCGLKSNGLTKIDDVEHVVDKLKRNDGNFSATAREYNVTPNAIVRYLKRHNMPFHRKDYQNKTEAIS